MLEKPRSRRSLRQIAEAGALERHACVREWSRRAKDEVDRAWPCLLYLGQALVALRSYGEADRVFRVAIDRLPREGKACLALVLAGESWQARGRFETELVCLTEARSREPEEPTPWIRGGACLLRLGRPQEAIRWFDRATRLGDLADEAHLFLAIALRNLGRYDEALEHVRRALGLDPTYEDALAVERDLVAVTSG